MIIFVSISSMRQLTSLLMINSFLPRPVPMSRRTLPFSQCWNASPISPEAYAHCSFSAGASPPICPSGTIASAGTTSGASSASCPVQHPFCSSAGSGICGPDIPSASAACLVGSGSAFNCSSSAIAARALSVHSCCSFSVNGLSLQLRRYSSYSCVPFCSSDGFRKKPPNGQRVFSSLTLISSIII